MSLRRCILLGLSWTVGACSSDVSLGSDLYWFARNETGDASEWTQGNAGGSVLGSSGSNVEFSAVQARSGARSVLFVTPSTGQDSGARLSRAVPPSSEAYYSAWYFVPTSYATRSYFTIMKFHSAEPADPVLFDTGIDINLRSLRDGQLVLYVLHHDGAFLEPPLAVPTPVVPVGRWFHVEVFFRATRDATGALAVWLDGRLLYDLRERPTLTRPTGYFSVCAMTNDAAPSPVELYVDDIAVSRTRVTERGIFSTAD